MRSTDRGCRSGGIKDYLLYKMLREVKNLFLQIYRAAYWQIVNTCYVVKDHFADKRLGIETSECIIDSDISIYHDMMQYTPAHYKMILYILDLLKLGPDDIFVDFGCGKGRVVFLAAGRNIKKAVGVEIEPYLVDCATANLRGAKGITSPVEFVKSDAGFFNITEGTIFFFYNPFGYKTMSKVADNIRSFLASSGSAVRVVYYGAVHRDIFDSASWLSLEHEIPEHDVIVWRSKKI